MTHLLTVVAGPASTRLATEVSELLQVQALAYGCQRFPDGETQVNLRESVRGRDIYVLQSTSPPIDAGDLPLAVTSVAPLIATAILRNHCDESLADLRVRG